MSVELFTSFDYADLNSAIAKFSRLAPEAARIAPRKAARGFVRRIVEITPPASAGRTGLAARRQGERRIDDDLKRIFVPVILRGQRREQYPDVEGIYREFMSARKGRGAPRLGNKFHVDARKFSALRDKLYGQVGFLAGGWNTAAREFGVEVPMWVSRHGLGNGSCRVRVNDEGILITLTNSVIYAADVSGYPRRVQAALDYEAAALERETVHLLILAGEKSGFDIR